jgi:hypothetical protein
VTLSGRAVKRLDNFMLMFAHAFSSAKDTTTLVHVACECLQSMIAGAAGTLMVLDKKAHEMWTVKHGAERRNPIHQGILGFVGKTSQSVYADLFKDERYNPSIDDVMLAKGESPSGSGGAKTWWGSNMPKINAGAGSPVVLAIPVRDYDGVTVAVLAAVRVHADEGHSVKPFNPNDALALAVLSCYVGGHMEKLSGRSRDRQVGVADVMKAMPEGVGDGQGQRQPQQARDAMLSPMHNERSNLNSLVQKMEHKASTMEEQASKMQYSTRNLEKRVAAMSSYAKDLEVKIGGAPGLARDRSVSYGSGSGGGGGTGTTKARRPPWSGGRGGGTAPSTRPSATLPAGAAGTQLVLGEAAPDTKRGSSTLPRCKSYSRSRRTSSSDTKNKFNL